MRTRGLLPGVFSCLLLLLCFLSPVFQGDHDRTIGVTALLQKGKAHDAILSPSMWDHASRDGQRQHYGRLSRSISGLNSLTGWIKEDHPDLPEIETAHAHGVQTIPDEHKHVDHYPHSARKYSQQRSEGEGRLGAGHTIIKHHDEWPDIGHGHGDYYVHAGDGLPLHPIIADNRDGYGDERHMRRTPRLRETLSVSSAPSGDHHSTNSDKGSDRHDDADDNGDTITTTRKTRPNASTTTTTSTTTTINNTPSESIKTITTKTTEADRVRDQHADIGEDGGDVHTTTTTNKTSIDIDRASHRETVTTTIVTTTKTVKRIHLPSIDKWATETKSGYTGDASLQSLWGWKAFNATEPTAKRTLKSDYERTRIAQFGGNDSVARITYRQVGYTVDACAKNEGEGKGGSGGDTVGADKSQDAGCDEDGNNFVQGHYALLHNPVDHFSIYQPPRGCNASAPISPSSSSSSSSSPSSSSSSPSSPPSSQSFLPTSSFSPSLESSLPRELTSVNARMHDCLVATNAGFWDSDHDDHIGTGGCFGNLVCDGKVVQVTGRHTAQFAIKGDYIYVGYLHPDWINNDESNDNNNDNDNNINSQNSNHNHNNIINKNKYNNIHGTRTTAASRSSVHLNSSVGDNIDARSGSPISATRETEGFHHRDSADSDAAGAAKEPVVQLVAGLGWLVRSGKNYVAESMKQEDLSQQQTGPQFADMRSARTALGHDRAGRVVLFQVDGKSWQRGVSLHALADLLIKHGVYNAINLDGGGSASWVMNGTLSNYVSDECTDATGEIMPDQFCERPVTTITCMHNKH